MNSSALKMSERVKKHLRGRVAPENMDTFLRHAGCRLRGEPSEFDEWDRKRLTIREFIEEPDYLNKRGVIYPAVMDELEEINSGKYVSAVLTGGIGSAKTTVALYTTAYQLYLLSCHKNPHALFGLDPSSEILFVFQNLNLEKAKSVDYDRFKDMLEGSRYFNEVFPFDRDVKSRLIFPKRLEVVPVTGADTAIIGQNVFGGVVDEVNDMAVVERSKRSRDGGVYDQAKALINAIERRRESRFMLGGEIYGMLCIVSSKKFPGQMTDIKTAEAERQIREKGRSTIYVYDKRVWDVKPEGTFSGETFRVFPGDETRNPRLLGVDEEFPGEVVDVPVEFKQQFEVDIINAVRDIAGVSTLARHPFLLNWDLASKCFSEKHKQVVSRDTVDFDTTQLKVYPKRFQNPEVHRWAHIDLGLTSDSAGLCVGHVTEFKEVKRGDVVEMLPCINIDVVLEIMPPKGGEILFSKVRSLLYKLRELGLNLKWVSLDSWQSTDTVQILRTNGFQTGIRSVDKTTEPYDVLKQALYDHRIRCSYHPKLIRELRGLEKDAKTNKIDHPPIGSKDVSDALAGVVFGLTMRKEIWHRHNIPLNQVPQSLVKAMNRTVTARQVQE